jgi:glutathione S-transferase
MLLHTRLIMARGRKLARSGAMQLLYSTTSPYARKLRVVMAELGLESQVELVPVVVMEDPALLSNANPLIKVPTLIIGPGPLESILD